MPVEHVSFVLRVRLKFFSGSRRNSFRSIFPVSNENENERRTRILSVPDRKGRGLNECPSLVSATAVTAL
jgi:hypothetical protein